jgi:hypothetical protein
MYKRYEIRQASDNLRKGHIHVNCGWVICIIPRSYNRDGEEWIPKDDLKEPNFDLWRKKTSSSLSASLHSMKHSHNSLSNCCCFQSLSSNCSVTAAVSPIATVSFWNGVVLSSCSGWGSRGFSTSRALFFFLEFWQNDFSMRSWSWQ